MLPAFARNYGGSRSSSRSSFSGFSSTRSNVTNYSRASYSTPSFSFSKPKPAPSISYTRPVQTPTRNATSYAQTPTRTVTRTATRVVRTQPTTVVHQYNNNGYGGSDLLTTALLLHAFSGNSNSGDSMNIKKSDLANIKKSMLKCFDQGGGRSCITNYL